MAETIKINVPDIGGAADVDVIEILVKVGDSIDVDTPLITLESDKASMEIPSPFAGTVKSIHLKTGDKVSEGNLILEMLSDSLSSEETVQRESEPVKKDEPLALENPPKEKQNASSLKEQEIIIPDIGGANDVDIIEIFVKPGDDIIKDQPLLTLEGDKATMDIPAPFAGKITRVLVSVGDKVSQGTPILQVESESYDASEPLVKKETNKSAPALANPIDDKPRQAPQALKVQDHVNSSLLLAGPAVRRLAREFGVLLNEVKGTGRKGRLVKEDIQAFVKMRLAEKPSGLGGTVSSLPVIDFSKFGPIELKPLNKIKRLTAVNVHRSWVSIPHVTQFDEADITELEAFRRSAELPPNADYKLTILAFVTKVVSQALSAYPQFNSSLDVSGDNLIYKQYVNIGIAVETPNGLVVPVIKDVNTLSVGQIAMEMARLSKQAREKGLMPADMSGGCFTISSLGGIGGTAFTPIVNGPEVAILGLSRASMKPIYQGNEFKPRLMLPLSLSYDHRVIDGAEAARFTRYIADMLADIRRILL